MIRRYALFTFLLLSVTFTMAQLSPLPMAISNNSVVSVNIDGKDYVYSFGGIGESKTYQDITLRSFKYDVAENVWMEIQSLPDTMGKIASAASVVDGLIYIIGGYYVFQDGHEKSSSKVHIYDPKKDQYLNDGPDIPTPIDDHVQAVWRDSLIYVVTGWSDSLNVNHVQVYDPKGHWHYGTSLPNEHRNLVFGSSGAIADNTIFFLGGAGNRQNKNFPVQSYLRKGVINAENPLEIEWSSEQNELGQIYRPASIIINNQIHWIGGSSKSYNYNGVAYTGELVNPVEFAVYFDPQSENLLKSPIDFPEIMDLRGAGQTKDGSVIVVGGMLKNQVVSDKTFVISIEE